MICSVLQLLLSACLMVTMGLSCWCRSAASSGARSSWTRPSTGGKGYERPNLAPEDVVVYEMGVRSFTADASSGVRQGQGGHIRRPHGQGARSNLYSCRDYS